MSGKYNAGRKAFGEGRLSWTIDRILAQLVSVEYKYQEGHAFDDLTGKLGKPIALAHKSIEDGWARAEDTLTFVQISGSDAAAVVLYSAIAKVLIAYLDGIVSFPMKTNGGDIVIEVPENGFFRL